VALRESTFRRTLQALDTDAPAGSALGGPPAARRPARRTGHDYIWLTSADET